MGTKFRCLKTMEMFVDTWTCGFQIICNIINYNFYSDLKFVDCHKHTKNLGIKCPKMISQYQTDIVPSVNRRERTRSTCRLFSHHSVIVHRHVILAQLGTSLSWEVLHVGDGCQVVFGALVHADGLGLEWVIHIHEEHVSVKKTSNVCMVYTYKIYFLKFSLLVCD